MGREEVWGMGHRYSSALGSSPPKLSRLAGSSASGHPGGRQTEGGGLLGDLRCRGAPGLGLASISLTLAFALGHFICSWGYDYIHRLKGLLLTDTLSSGWNSLEALNSSQHWAAAP